MIRILRWLTSFMAFHALFLVVLFTMAAAVFAQDYYVDSEKGDDSNQGTSPIDPWKTLKKVNSTQYKPGDSVLFKRGTVAYGILIPSSSGTDEHIITFGAYGIGPKPVIMGSLPLSSLKKVKAFLYHIDNFDWSKSPSKDIWEVRPHGVIQYISERRIPDRGGQFFWDEKEKVLYIKTFEDREPSQLNIDASWRHSEHDTVLFIDGKSHIVVEDIAFMFGNKTNVVIRKSSKITIRSIDAMYNGSFGNPNIILTGRDNTNREITIENCFVYDSMNSGIAVLDGERITIRNNRIDFVRSNDGITLHQKMDGSRIGDHCIVENNTISNAQEDGIDITSGDMHIIRNNISFNNREDGILIGHDADRLIVERNRVFGNARHGIYIGCSPGEGCIGKNRIRNNLSYENGRTSCYLAAPETLLDYNTFLHGRPGREALFIDAGSDGSVITNNIIAASSPKVKPTGFSLEHKVDIVIENNLVQRSSASENPDFEGLKRICATCIFRTDNLDAVFRQVKFGDFRLTENSPALKKGRFIPKGVELPSEDIEGRTRIGCEPDLGAFQFELCLKRPDGSLKE